jgi:hypothetical protein
VPEVVVAIVGLEGGYSGFRSTMLLGSSSRSADQYVLSNVRQGFGQSIESKKRIDGQIVRVYASVTTKYALACMYALALRALAEASRFAHGTSTISYNSTRCTIRCPLIEMHCDRSFAVAGTSSRHWSVGEHLVLNPNTRIARLREINRSLRGVFTLALVF